jgi:hypothetical protein
MKDSSNTEILIIQKLIGKAIGDLFLENPKRGASCLSRYAHDLKKMWEKTVEPIEESRLAIDCRSGYIKRLESFFYFRDTERFLQLPVIINGICYKKIGEILEKTLESLRSRTDSVMVLGHGDDHLANILTDDLSSKPNYYIIDPKLAGFYPPTISYLNTAMYLLLYKYQYIVKENVAREEIRIEYGIPNESVSSKYGMIDVLKIMEYGLLELGGGLGMFREYAIANLLRFVQHLNDPKNFKHTQPNQLAYLALAIELANNKYSSISEIYENIR